MNRDDEQRRVAETYRRYASSARRQRGWAAGNRGNLAIRRELVQAVYGLAHTELFRAQRILDLGCGSGWWLAHLAGAPAVSADLCGVDILPERLEAARGQVPGAQLELADARTLPFEETSFDLVTMFTVLSSLASADDVDRTLREAARVLRPAGAIVIWEPRLPNPANRRTILIDRRRLRAALPEFEANSRTLTLLPPLARRLGRRADRVYPVLAWVPALRTHRLTVLRRRG